MIKIYNTMSKEKEELKPMIPGVVNIYVCGITVYDYCHLGHGRMVVSFDMITRYLAMRGFKVNYVRNITDIDDKIINRALDNGEDFLSLAGRFIQAMNEDFAALNVLPPTHEPKATEHVDKIIQMVQQLIDKDYAYVASNGDVYYAVNKYQAYGQLSHKDLEGLQAGARVDIGELKRDPLDFVLWKSAKPNEPSWESPWGPGRPGWHIECSAMSTNMLGAHFDIHGGGTDLQFPHHENEIAQSEAATGEKFVNLWMHVGFLQINQEKMSKSLNNFFTIREVLKNYMPEVVRYLFIASQYRSPLNYSTETLEGAKAALERFYTALRDLPKTSVGNLTVDYEARFYAAMDDDFNTPEALAVLFEIARDINRHRDKDVEYAARLATELRRLAQPLGILQDDAERFLQFSHQSHATSDQEIEILITNRATARLNKQWAESDRIRDELLNKGIVLEDTAHGTKWRRN